MEINKCKVSYSIGKRRVGDVPILIADNKEAIKTLNWKPKFNIADMCRDGWDWYSKGFIN